MPDQETLKGQLDLLDTFRRRLRVQIDQQTRLGAFAPPYIQMEIDDAQKQIRKIKTYLRQNDVRVEDAPEDGNQEQSSSTIALSQPQTNPATPSIADLFISYHSADQVKDPSDKSPARSSGAITTADIGIITVVPEEMNAVISLIKEEGTTHKERKDGAVFYSGHLPAESGRTHSVVATQQLKQGNRSVVLAFERLVKHYQPAVVILLGIGGSIHSDVRLCDVVIADQVVWYEQATIDEQGMRFKGEASELAPELRVLINDFFANRGYPFQLPTASLGSSGPPRALFGPIGSGEKVVRYRDAAVRKWLLDFNYKTFALETEAGGLAQAFYEAGLTLAYRARGYLVVRAISDHADAAKDDRWRAVASKNACIFLREFLSFVPPLREVLGEASPL